MRDRPHLDQGGRLRGRAALAAALAAAVLARKRAEHHREPEQAAGKVPLSGHTHARPTLPLVSSGALQAIFRDPPKHAQLHAQQLRSPPLESQASCVAIVASTSDSDMPLISLAGQLTRISYDASTHPHRRAGRAARAPGAGQLVVQLHRVHRQPQRVGRAAGA